MIPSSTLSLLNAQKDAFQAILNPQSTLHWKVLLYDTHSQRILSTLFRVGDLREMCITLHFNIDQMREKLHSVLAIYLLQPSQDSLKKLISDFQQDLYSRVIINFASPIAPEDLQYLAKEVARIPGAAQKIEKVFAHNVDFICLNHNFFQLDPANGLLSIILTLKVSPLIIYQKKHESLAKGLIEKLKTFELSPDYPTLALVLPDRDDDLNPMIMHSHTYGALMHDIFNIKFNKVCLDKSNGQTYDLWPEHDQLWSEICNLPQEQASQKIDEALNDWKLRYQNIQAQSTEIKSAMNSIDLVPQMNQQKKLVDQHVNLSFAIISVAKERRLDKFQKIGFNVVYGEQIQPADIQQIEDQKGSQIKELDKVRILALMLLNNYPNYSKYEQMLSVKDEKSVRILQSIKQKVGFSQETQQQPTAQTKFKSIFSSITSKVQNHGKGLLKNVQNMLIQKEKRFAIVDVIENLFNNEFRSDELLSLFEIYEGKSRRYVVSTVSNQNADVAQLSSIKDVLVCFADGACYNEYAELAEYAKQINKNIIYGGSKIYTAEEQLERFLV